MRRFSQIKLIHIFPLFIGVIGIISSVFLFTKTEEKKITSGGCISTFADGGGPYYKENAPFREKIVPDSTNGEELTVRGRILKNDCITPIRGAVLDIWQANDEGSYEDDYYRGKVRSNEKGEYTFETVVPKGYGEGTAFRPPHIHFKVYIDDQEVITSQMFFPESQGRPGFNDAYIMSLKSVSRFGKYSHEGTHDIIVP